MDWTTETFPLLLALGALAALVVFLVVHHLLEKRRTEKLRQVADELGLPFYPQGDQKVIHWLAHLHLFSRGHMKKVHNMFHGDTDDVELAIFDYKYTTGSGKSSRTWRQTVALFRSPALAHLPGFAIRPERFYHKVGAAFGYQDLDFPSHPRFSGKYLVRGGDETAVRNLLTDGVLSTLETTDGIALEADRGCLVYYQPAERVAPRKIRPFLDDAFALYSLFKHHHPADHLTPAPTA